MVDSYYRLVYERNEDGEKWKGDSEKWKGKKAAVLEGRWCNKARWTWRSRHGKWVQPMSRCSCSSQLTSTRPVKISLSNFSKKYIVLFSTLKVCAGCFIFSFFSLLIAINQLVFFSDEINANHNLVRYFVLKCIDCQCKFSRLLKVNNLKSHAACNKNIRILTRRRG